MRIAFTYAALNQVEVNAAYIQIAFLQAPASERHYIICGTEFGLENIGKRALIKRALYGGKSARSDFWQHSRSCIQFLVLNRVRQNRNFSVEKLLKRMGQTTGRSYSFRWMMHIV